MHICMWCALNAHSIRIGPNRIVCEMVQCAFKTELGRNVKRPLVMELLYLVALSIQFLQILVRLR